MVLKRQDALKIVVDGISWLAMVCKRRGQLHLFDGNTISHEFFRRLLDEIYGLRLAVMDRVHANFPAIDLGDDVKRHAFQVTSDGTSTKIQATLDTFVRHELNMRFDKIQIVVIGDKQATYGVLQVPTGIQFSTDTDIVDIRSLLKHIDTLETAHIERIAEVVRGEIKTYIDEQPKRKRVIKVVFFASNPRETPQFTLAGEIANIVELVRSSELRRYLDFSTWWIDRFVGMCELICNEEPLLIHFLGSNEPSFCLTDNNGVLNPVSTQELKEFFEFLRGKVKLVVLGPGFSDEQAAIICSEIEFAIQLAVMGVAATKFSATLYRSLAEGKCIRAAYDEAALGVEKESSKLHHRPEVNPADVELIVNQDKSHSEKTIRFVQTEMATKLCLWREMRHNCQPEAPPYHPIHGRPWFNQVYNIGPKAWYPFGSHQIYNSFWPEGQKEADGRIADPIIDFTILNGTDTPCVLSRIGIRPVNGWNAAKAAPIAFKLSAVDAYELRIEKFEVGVDLLLLLTEPVYLEVGVTRHPHKV